MEILIGVFVIIIAIIIFSLLAKKEKSASNTWIEEVINLQKSTETFEPYYKLRLDISGLSYKNYDGTNRMYFADKLKKDDKLILVPEPDNPADKHAVKITTAEDNQIGYIPRKYSKCLYMALYNKETVHCEFEKANLEMGHDKNYYDSAIIVYFTKKSDKDYLELI